MINLVRKSSSTPSITNKDDVRMIRYAYGNYNGVVKDFGSELESTYDNSIRKFRIGSGRVVLHGWEVDIDEGGWEMTLSLTSGTQYYTVYLEVNALAETAEIKTVYNSYASYPEPDLGDDLTQIPTGTARLILFRFEVYNGYITKSEREVSTVAYLKDYLETILEADKQTVKKSTNAENAIKQEDGTYVGFTLTGGRELKASHLQVRVYQTIPDFSVTITRDSGEVPIEHERISVGPAYRCRYRAVSYNNGSTQGYIDLILKTAVTNAQIFSIKMPYSNSFTAVSEFFLVIYRNSAGKIVAKLIDSYFQDMNKPSANTKVQVILDQFEVII